MVNPKCPRCGNQDTARFLYGLTVFSENLEQELNSGETILCGCCITDFDPKYRCNSCKKDFGAPPHTKDFQDFKEQIRAITFCVGGYFDGYFHIGFYSPTNGSFYQVSEAFMPSGYEEKHELSADEWLELVNKLYDSLFLGDWKNQYVDKRILDGTQWELTILLEGRRKRHYYGSNDYPVYWEQLVNLFQPYFEAVGVRPHY